MDLDDQKLRIEGIYRQNERGEYMQRVKLPGGVLSRVQAAKIAEIGESAGSGVLHLSTRGSIEFHGLLCEDLPSVSRSLASVGLFSRGACGGAVRGISCSSNFGMGFARIQVVLRHFLTYFSGNPHFEGLPKKFKICFETGYDRSRHLIQDLAFVLVEEKREDSLYDVWFAGGLGREPQQGILFAERIQESELLPLAEAIIESYQDWGVKGRRLKHMLNDLGESELRARVALKRQMKMKASFHDAFAKELLPDGDYDRIPLDIFAGELPAARLTEICRYAMECNCDWLLVTPDQDLELLALHSCPELEEYLVRAGFELQTEGSFLRVCPGNHECRMGLSATRKIAKLLKEELGPLLTGRTIAVSGCHNSCAQPQLAEFGIISRKLHQEGTVRTPLFDVYERDSESFGKIVASGLAENELVSLLKKRLDDKK